MERPIRAVPAKVLAALLVAAVAAACHSSPASNAPAPSASPVPAPTPAASLAPAPAASPPVAQMLNVGRPVSAASAPSAGGVPVFDAVGGIVGGVRIGMTRAEAKAVLPLAPHPSGQMGGNVQVAGPYYVVFDEADAISSIEYNVTQSPLGVRIGTMTLPPSSTAASLAKAIGGCTSPTPVDGGEQIECRDGRAMVKIGMSCAKKDPRGACERWTHEKLDVMVQVFAKP